MTVDEKLQLDSTIFHYTQAKTALEHILPFSRLKLSLLAETGDPLEYKFWMLGAIGSIDLEEHLNKAHPIIDRIRRQEFRMASFCMNRPFTASIDSDVTRLGCVRSRMWSQYGDGHHGVCLAFDSNALTESIRRESARNVYFGSIEYDVSKMKAMRLLDGEAIQQMGLKEYCQQHVLRNYENFFLKKDPDFDDEVEFRILVWDPEQQLRYVEIKDSLIAVIIGDRFPDGFLPSVSYFCTKSEVGCRRVYYSMSTGNPIVGRCMPMDHQLKKDWEDFEIKDPT
jgi:hypothetical protein